MNSGKIYPLYISGIGYKMWLPQSETDYIQTFLAENEIPYELEMLLESVRWMKPGWVVIDAGGNIGNHSLFWALHGADVLYFEPLEELVEIAKENFKLNNVQDRLSIYNVALGANSGGAVVVDKQETNLGATKIVSSQSGPIKVISIDSLNLDRLDCLKIDVEGSEKLVLEGAAKTIGRLRPLIFSETIDDESLDFLVQFMEASSYIYWNTFNATPTHFFIPKERISSQEWMTHSLEQLKHTWDIKKRYSEALTRLREANLKYRRSTEQIQLLKDRLGDEK